MKALVEVSSSSGKEENNFKQDLKTKLLGLKNVMKILFSTRKMLLLTLCLMMSFLAVGMGSYGVHFAVKFSNNKTSVLLVPSYWLNCLSFYLSPDTVRPVLYILTASLFIGDYFLIGTFTSEILPTPARSG